MPCQSELVQHHILPSAERCRLSPGCPLTVIRAAIIMSTASADAIDIASAAERKDDVDDKEGEEEQDADVSAADEQKGGAPLSVEDKKRLANRRKKDKAKQRKQQQKQHTANGPSSQPDTEMQQLSASFPALSMHRYFQPPLSLAFNPRQGRHLLLSSPLPAHSLLFSQLPYGHVVTDSHSAIVCHRCLTAESSVMLKCSVCQFAHYCSSTCKRGHEKLHAVECGLLNQLKRMQGSSASIRLLIRLLVQKRDEDELIAKHHDKMKALKKKDHTPTTISSSPSPSLPSSLQPGQSFGDVSGLQSHVHALDAQNRLELLTLIASLRSLLGATFDALADDELMLRLLCIVHVNAHHITNVNKEKLALGLFTAPSLMNHSCLPTAFYYFTERGEMHMRLLADTPQAAELTYAYTDVYQRRSERWRVLKEVYHMHDGCDCIRCSVPLEKSWDRYIEGVQCNQCQSGLLVRGAQQEWTCDGCQKCFTQQQVDECREDAELIAQQAMSLLSARQYEPLVNAVQSKLLHPPATASYPLRLHPYSDLCFQSYFLLMNALPALPSSPPPSSASFSSLTDCCRLVVECMEGAGLAPMVEWSDVQVVWGEADVREGREDEGRSRLEQAKDRRERQYGKRHLLTKDAQHKLNAVSNGSNTKDKGKR